MKPINGLVDVIALADPYVIPTAAQTQPLARAAASPRVPLGPAAAPGLIQMFANNPGGRLDGARFLHLDKNGDGQITLDEVTRNTIFESFVSPDLMVSGQAMLSLGFAAHLAPCPSGSCAAPPADTCFDRVRDGDETDIDCGGSCRRCAGGSTCNAATDCQAGACNAGTCPEPSCSDGVQDGFESDVDCGWNCPPCAAGKACGATSDCASGSCVDAVKRH